ncbi:hypothetical protein MA16_Dca028015 [Dendrobium catenatum]|uniref:Uncharacterized protein n=1 Tax=Dendrobium catenatum TaxID=906689 RepID=A0A2I0VAL9_9ASPA|nr:hypothetical protein MA16_Dca028015 [Dendrobium catenatum]
MDQFVSRRRAQADQPSGNIDDSREAVEEPPEIVGVDSNGSTAGGRVITAPTSEKVRKTFALYGDWGWRCEGELTCLGSAMGITLTCQPILIFQGS